jgi:hypothetical protein
MNELEARFRSAHGRLDEAAVVLDEVERALAVAHNAEVKAEREGAFIVRAGVVVAGAAVAVVVGILFLRWFFEKPKAEPDESVGPDGSSDQAAEME